MLLTRLEGLREGIIINRPSKIIKSPYVADVLLNGKEIMAHTPSLGCCGLAERGSNVLMMPIEKKKNKEEKCIYRVVLSIYKENELAQEQYIGIYPLLAENIVEECIKKNGLQFLKNIKSYMKQTEILNSKFDFTGIDENNIPFILEVKNVPLADYVDCSKKEKKKIIDKLDKSDINKKIAYFPDGYRKSSNDIVSPRALKHINELCEIKKASKTRTICCFVIERTDVDVFQPSHIDEVYRKAVQDAWISGVEIMALMVRWERDGTCRLVNNSVPIKLFEEIGPINKD